MAQDYQKMNLNLKRFFFLQNYYCVPNTFIQFIDTYSGIPEPHLHYYKLYDYLKYKHKRFKMFYLPLQTLKEEEREKIKSIFKIKDNEELSRISYVLSDKLGSFTKFYKENENLDLAKRILIGIPRIDSLDELNLNLNKFTEETIHILSSGDNNFTNKIFKRFYENSVLFNQNTFNFMNYNLGIYEMLSEEIFKPLFNKNEILILFNKKLFNVNELKNIRNNLYVYSKKSKELIKIDKDTDLTNEANNILAFKYTPESNDNFQKETENFVNFITNFIEKTENQNIPTRYSYTNNIDIANYFKLKYVNEKLKTIFVYVNSENLYKMKMDPEKITEFFINTLEDFNKTQKIKYIVTNNHQIATLFNIHPKYNENLTIRFIDYGALAKFNDNLNGEFKVTKDFNILQKANKNLLFYYKTNYNKKSINEDELIHTINEFVNNENNFFNNNPQYLENVDLLDTTNLTNLNGSDFKNKFLEVPGKKILLCVSDNCIGCPTIKQILENMQGLPKTFIFDVRNETIHFKKVRKSPLLILYDGEKVVKEIDINRYLSNNEFSSYELSVHNLIIENFQSNK